MKNKIIIAIAFLCMIIGYLYIGYLDTHYTRKATYQGDGRFIDNCGYEWVYDGDFTINNQYELRMYNNGTDATITDDEILEVK